MTEGNITKFYSSEKDEGSIYNKTLSAYDQGDINNFYTHKYNVTGNVNNFATSINYIEGSVNSMKTNKYTTYGITKNFKTNYYNSEGSINTFSTEPFDVVETSTDKSYIFIM